MISHEYSRHSTGDNASAEQARVALERRRLNFVRDKLDSSISDVYMGSDTLGGLALERAQGVVDQQESVSEKTFGAAQRTIEATIGQGAWTDTVREAAVYLNREASDRPVLDLEQVIGELEGYHATWKQAARTEKDEWIDNEANALGYHLGGAKRSEVEGLDGTLRAVEKMLGGGMGNSDEVRGASELRAMRDTLFIEKQRMQAAQEEAARKKLAEQKNEAAVDDIRSTIKSIYNESAPEQRSPTPDNSVGRDPQQGGALRHKLEELSPEEKEFRGHLVDVMGVYGVSTAGELGLSKNDTASITHEQRATLTALFKRYARDRLRYAGDEEVASVRERLRGDIETVLAMQYEPHGQEESAYIDARDPQIGAGKTTEAHSPVDEQAVTSEIVMTQGPVERPGTKDPGEVPVESHAQEAPDETQKLAETHRKQAHNFIGRYFGGSSANVGRGILLKIAGEVGKEPAELYEQFRAGDIAVDEQTIGLISQLHRQGYRPNSPGWLSRNTHSTEGRIAVQSSEALEQILRRMLS